MRKSFLIAILISLLSLMNIYSQEFGSVFGINYILSTSNVEGSSVVSIESGNEFKYVSNSDGVKFAYSIPLKNIARGEIVSTYGKYFAALWCDDEEYYCVESVLTENGKRMQSHERLINIETSSTGDAELILKHISSLADRYSNNDFYNVNVPQISERKVFICHSRSAYAYHSTNSCSGLGNCEYTIYKVSESDARTDGYIYCELCWE